MEPRDASPPRSGPRETGRENFQNCPAPPHPENAPSTLLLMSHPNRGFLAPKRVTHHFWEIHAWWGRPEEMTMSRPAWSITCDSPGSDLAAETSAALASSYLYFTKRGDTAYAEQLLTHARSLFQFADEHRGVYTDAIPNASGFYQS